MKTSPLIVLASLCMATLTLDSQPVMHARQKSVSGTFLQRQAQMNRSRTRTAALMNQVYFPDTLILRSTTGAVRMTASYDQTGSTTQRLTEIWSNGQWVNSTVDSWTYLNANGNSLDLMQTWVNGHWVNSTLDSSTYDAHGNMLVHLYEYWENGQWQDSILSSRTYDANGHMLTDVGWYMTNNHWTNHDQSIYTYDGSGNRLSFLFQSWGGGVWVNSDVWNYTYDANGHMLTSLMQVWYGQWQNATLATYTYDANGNMLSFLLQTSASGQWTNSTLHTYTYDANGKMLTDWFKGWTNAAWMNGSLSTYTYDTNGNMVNELIQYWLNGVWSNYRQSTITYDAHRNELTGYNTLWSGSSWVPSDNTFTVFFYADSSNYDFTGDSITISYTLLNISDVSTKTSDISSGYSLSQNYPNPFNPTTDIRYSVAGSKEYGVGSMEVKLVVYDILGREVAVLVNEWKSPGNYEVKFDGSGLASGVYFYRLTAGSFAQTRKLCLLR